MGQLAKIDINVDNNSDTLEFSEISVSNNDDKSTHSPYAIPDFTDTINTQLSADNREPGSWKCVATNQINPLMNGTYTVVASRLYYGNNAYSGPNLCFKRILPGNIHGWLSRTTINNYDTKTGKYNSDTETNINNKIIKGEWIRITAPYSFIVKSYNIVSGNYEDNKNTPIKSWTIGGSNDGGSTYTLIDEQISRTITGNKITEKLTTNTQSYNTYILIITEIAPGGGSGANIDSWNLLTK
jgi:hypothetical protein